LVVGITGTRVEGMLSMAEDDAPKPFHGHRRERHGWMHKLMEMWVHFRSTSNKTFAFLMGMKMKMLCLEREIGTQVFGDALLEGLRFLRRPLARSKTLSECSFLSTILLYPNSGQ
jgi:hypothetical protein